MKEGLSVLVDFLLMKTRASKITNYSIAGIFAIYAAIIIHPNPLFSYVLKYKNFEVYSTQPIGEQMSAILDGADKNLSSSELYSKASAHKIYLCNSYKLYAFLAPLDRRSTACNYPFIDNIFIANCKPEKNEAYRSIGGTPRRLSETIAHEVTHSFIEKKLGFWRYKFFTSWKNEGYCEYIGYNDPNVLTEAGKYLRENQKNNDYLTIYRRYYYAVAFLKEREKMSFDKIVNSNLTLDEVLEKFLNGDKGSIN